MQTAARVRTIQAEELSLALIQRSSALTRVFFARSRADLSRTDAGVLAALSRHPRRVTELAAIEGISQPAATQLVNRLERRRWVERDSDPRDARVVLVRLTDAGSEQIARLRASFRAILHEELTELDDVDVETLSSAVAILDRMIARFDELR